MGGFRTDRFLKLDDVARQVGKSRQRVEQIELEAFEKIRALILGTDDFPLLRQHFAHKFPMVEQDLKAARAQLEKRARLKRLRNARKKAGKNDSSQGVCGGLVGGTT